MSENGGRRGGLFSWFLGNRTITNVSPTTEVGIPRMTWRMMMLSGTLIILFVWSIGWAASLYDAMQRGMRWYRWSRQWLKWWDGGGWVLVLITQLVGWLASTTLFYYRMMTEQGAKEWRSEYGAYYPGKRVPPEERLP